MPDMTEDQLTAEVRRLAGLYKVRAIHIPDSRRIRDAAGMPDFLLLGPLGLIWRELKRPFGVLSDRQQDFHRELVAVGQDVAVWRPLDLQTGHIAQELQAIARPPC
jgi:hypothetical protein